MDFKALLKQKLDAQQTLIDAAMVSGTGFSAEQQTQFDTLQAEIVNLENTIKAAAELEARQKEMTNPVNQPLYPEPKAKKEKFASFGEQLRAVIEAARPGGSMDNRLSIKAAAGLNENVGSDGGFLVDDDFSKEILKRAYDTGILASRCNKVPLSTNATGLKINAIDESSRANGSRWGGIQAYWEGESDQLLGSKPKFRQMELNLHKLTGLCYATDELLTDATALESVISQGFAEEFGFKMDDGIINGTGAGMPLGIMNSKALVTVPKENSQASGTINIQNIVKMWSRCWGQSRQNAVWFINQDIEPQLYTMALSVGTGGIPVYMPAGGISGSPYSTLYGRPVIPLEQCQTLGTVGDIVLADLSQYLIIDKGGLSAASSIHVRFLYDENCFRFIYRVDGQPVWNTVLTPARGSNTLSPFVALQTR
ncbi:phage capsid family protein [Desulfosporosinus acidiphilus SJ4]|uniref:Phage capsid family protein n=1 Tax=Desulfosporosinus acidiphilus (strain DSM 22704 / JCM 16185 / SJ4) TaxID=646529 RepID=I4D3F3_DESAJ|nr:phage major capsid protein [Desulfosporosinus acidiphilus]AFM40327.1 phage capsid family protein [Desulfosporosinus acidiphilus SJ4]